MILIVSIFVIGYLAIAFEHPLGLNKAASALLAGVLCWVVYVVIGAAPLDLVEQQLYHYFGEISAILFFLLGAMTIVELIDSHGGFELITERIQTKSKFRLLLIVTFFTFFLSSFLDNLTTAIVMTSLTAKVLDKKEDRLWFTSMIVIASNAGGAFSPLGDVTTTMLWIGGQITAQSIVLKLFLPSVAVCLIPFLIIGRRFRNQKLSNSVIVNREVNRSEANLILILGILLLIFVPIFKVLTHLPPFMGILLAVSLLWVITSLLHVNKEVEQKNKFSVANALQRVDTPSILFFLGILLGVSALQSVGALQQLGIFLQRSLGNDYLIGIALGIISSVVDNVPLVAAAQGMYDLSLYPSDHNFWEFLALSTGTGGSAIIIGSAAGVAAMGIEQIDFIWYLKKIAWIALAGFASGIVVFMIQVSMFSS
jgi:Na+/H+ antiporter NhaD/arsenite permease-like protein